MNQYVTLVGTEAIRHTGYQIEQAANEMLRSVSYQDDNLRRFLERFEALVERMETALREANP